jgi:hypothetical protein
MSAGRAREGRECRPARPARPRRRERLCRRARPVRELLSHRPRHQDAKAAARAHGAAGSIAAASGVEAAIAMLDVRADQAAGRYHRAFDGQARCTHSVLSVALAPLVPRMIGMLRMLGMLPGPE